MTTERRWTLAEYVALVLIAGRLRAEVDAELGDLCERLARGERGLFPALHDRLLIVGRPELADRLRALVEE